MNQNELEHWESRAEAAEAEVARLRNQVVTGIYDAASVGITLIKTEEVDRLRSRIAELEAVMRHVAKTTSDPDATDALDAALLGEDA